MIQVTQDLRSKNSLEMAQYAEDRALAIENNPNLFATPSPTPAQLRAQAVLVRSRLGIVEEAKTALSVAYEDTRTETVKLSDLLTQEGAYVQGVANANGNTDEQATTIIKASGMGVKSSGTPATLLPAPMELSLTQGDETGEVDAHCHSIKGTSFYQWETSLAPDPNTGSWTNQTPTTKSSTTLHGQPSGAIVWVRVRAANTVGPGPASAPISIRVA